MTYLNSVRAAINCNNVQVVRINGGRTTGGDGTARRSGKICSMNDRIGTGSGRIGCQRSSSLVRCVDHSLRQRRNELGSERDREKSRGRTTDRNQPTELTNKRASRVEEAETIPKGREDAPGCRTDMIRQLLVLLTKAGGDEEGGALKSAPR